MKPGRKKIYHQSLRVAALSLALVLVFDSGLLHPLTKELSSQTQIHLANVISVGAAVEQTELNAITAELTRKENELEAREAALSSREIEVNLGDSQTVDNAISTYILSILLFIIIVLIVLNYALDFARESHLRKLGNVIKDEKVS